MDWFMKFKMIRISYILIRIKVKNRQIRIRLGYFILLEK